MTYLDSVRADGEEVVWKQHLAVPTSHDEGADICRLVGWVERRGAVAHVVLLVLSAPRRLFGDPADTKRKADLVSEWSRDVRLARDAVFPLLVHLEGIALAKGVVAHGAHANDRDELTAAELVIVPVVVPVSSAVTCA
jgi:hypothetical protein